MSVILETKQLCKFYGTGENQVKAVNQVDIQIEQGEFVAIVGKSGSGKSTLLHMLGGLDTPTKGSVTLAGKDLYRMNEDALAVFRRRKIGFVFQAFNLVSSVNVWENIVLPLGLDGRKVDEAYVNDIIATLGIENRIYNLPNQLSGGQYLYNEHCRRNSKCRKSFTSPNLDSGCVCTRCRHKRYYSTRIHSL